MRSSLGVVALSLLAAAASSAHAAPNAPNAPKKPAKPPGKGFWKILVQPGAKWVLRDQIAKQIPGHEVETLTVETYDVRKIGDADVARLRWSLGDDHDALHFTHAGPITQVAVTPAGLYLMWASMDDAAVAKALAGKPSRSDPPKAYKATKLNEGRYLEIRDDLVCMGQGPAPGDAPCDDTCEGEVCISATAGIVTLMGTWTPGVTEFAQDNIK